MRGTKLKNSTTALRPHSIKYNRSSFEASNFHNGNSPHGNIIVFSFIKDITSFFLIKYEQATIWYKNSSNELIVSTIVCDSLNVKPNVFFCSSKDNISIG